MWREPVVQAFVEEFQLHKVDFDGCAVGLVHSVSGQPLLKPWRIYTDNKAIVSRLIDKRCANEHTHGSISGSETAKTASYPKQLCILLHEGFTHSDRFELPVVPASFAELTESAKMVVSQAVSGLLNIVSPAAPVLNTIVSESIERDGSTSLIG